MKLGAQEQDLAALRGVIARQSVQLIGLLAVLALALVTVLLMVGRERTVVTPPTLQKSFWVEGDQVSGSYLEQMAGWIATLILDVSPGNIDYNKTILLQYAAPDAHGALAQAMELAAAKLKRDNATTLFAVQQLTPDEPTHVGGAQGAARHVHQRQARGRHRKDLPRRLPLRGWAHPTHHLQGSGRCGSLSGRGYGSRSGRGQ